MQNNPFSMKYNGWTIHDHAEFGYVAEHPHMCSVFSKCLRELKQGLDRRNGDLRAFRQHKQRLAAEKEARLRKQAQAKTQKEACRLANNILKRVAQSDATQLRAAFVQQSPHEYFVEVVVRTPLDGTLRKDLARLVQESHNLPYPFNFSESFSVS